MRQYLELKARHPDAILFFRVGDFYEMFFEDAVTASRILQIALTSRDKQKENAVPLCGIPHHAASGYIPKLLNAGHSVALCEQMEEATAVKGKAPLRREVVRVITPGTIIETELLSPKENNYIASLAWDAQGTRIGLAYLDLSTGDFRMSGFPHGWDVLEGEWARINPREAILPNGQTGVSSEMAPLMEGRSVRFVSPAFFAPDSARAALAAHFKVHTADVLGDDTEALVAAGALLGYVQSTHKATLGSIVTLKAQPHGPFMRLSAATQRHLSLLPTSRERAADSLLHLLDGTLTPMGGRLLKEWMLHPLMETDQIARRQEAVAAFHDHLAARTMLRLHLKQVSDMDRLMGRISLGVAQPRDLVSLSTSFSTLPDVAQSVAGLNAALIRKLMQDWDDLAALVAQITTALVDDPPPSLREGGVIRDGYSAELDRLRQFQKEGRTRLVEIERNERQRSGIDSLKVRYNQVFGYYIEVSETHLAKVPSDYIRKQTLTRAERFTTTELREMEERMTGAAAALLSLEREAFDALCRALTSCAQFEGEAHPALPDEGSVPCGGRREPRAGSMQFEGEAHPALPDEGATRAPISGILRVQEMARKVAILDLLAALAEVAHQNHYVRPIVNESGTLRIVDGRHPMLARTQEGFVPNDTRLSPPARALMILTGPNMAGKSTYMRQVALIVLMAQMGGFVPAKEATLGVVDQILSRVGAEDDPARGMSTFMVEMAEMSRILRGATVRSLLLLDEIGRGTSTYDGMSIAQAIVEHVHAIGARTLFATHYHELTHLESLPGVCNAQTLVRTCDDEIVFLRKIVEGGAQRSFGIHVARLAGLPPEIVQRARQLLNARESGEISAVPQNPGAPEEAPHPAVVALRQIDPLHVTPLQALQTLTDLVEQAKA
jgi:DNA mismatch repair protein MutS